MQNSKEQTNRAEVVRARIMQLLHDDDWLRKEIRHEFGPAYATSADSTPVVCCLVRDGGYWLPAFLGHYRNIGVEEFFFLDNGSRDQTLEILRNERNVGVYSCNTEHFKHFNTNLRRILIETVRPEGWTLGVDIDEFFDYPFSNGVPLPSLCEYLQSSGFDSMSTHQLDMFPDGPIDSTHRMQCEDPRSTCPLYSLAGLRSNNYECADEIFEGLSDDPLILPSKAWKFYYDGLRFRKFGVDIWLTKHALFRMGGRLVPFHHAHIHRNLTVADVSGVLYHYKFTPLFADQIETALREKQYCDNSSDYVFYSKVVNSGNELILKDETAQRLNSVNELLDQSFLEAPCDFGSSF